MSFTNDPANSVTDRIRLMVGDVDDFEEGLSDEVYEYIIDKHTTDGVVNEVQASLEVLRGLVAKYANLITEKAGGLFAKESDKYDHYKELLDDWTKNPSSGFMSVGVGFAGGISREDIYQNREDGDTNLNPFHLGDKSRLN